MRERLGAALCLRMRPISIPVSHRQEARPIIRSDISRKIINDSTVLNYTVILLSKKISKLFTPGLWIRIDSIWIWIQQFSSIRIWFYKIF
jgi:hypothetical protein